MMVRTCVGSGICDISKYIVHSDPVFCGSLSVFSDPCGSTIEPKEHLVWLCGTSSGSCSVIGCLLSSQ